MESKRPDLLHEDTPRGVGEILQDALNMLRKNFLLVIGIDLSFVPLFLFAFDIEKLSENLAAADGSFIVLGLIVWALQAIGSAALTYAASELYLGRNVDIAGAFWAGSKRLLPLVVTQLLGSVMILGGVLLFLVPGIYLAIAFLLVSAVVVLEGVSMGGALLRSHALMTGHMLRGMILVLISMAVLVLVNMIAGIVSAVVPDLVLLIGVIGQTAVTGYFAMVFVIFYYDLRSSKEGFSNKGPAVRLDELYPERPRPIA